MGFLDRLRGAQPRSKRGERRGSLPDPSQPPGNRGEWDRAALTNVDITERVKRELRTDTRPWEK